MSGPDPVVERAASVVGDLLRCARHGRC